MRRPDVASARWHAGAFVAAVACLYAPRAHADLLERFSFHFEGGAGTVLSDYQQRVQGYSWGAVGAARLGFQVFGPLSLQASAAAGWFPRSGQETGRFTEWALGVRVEPRVGHLGRFFIDANAAYAQTGPLARFMFDAGLGFEFDVTRFLGVGPYARYYQILQDRDQSWPQGDAQFWTAGLSITLRWPEREERAHDEHETPQDKDHDGVPDDQDQCPEIARGDHPDESRAGCPLPDRDADGVPDADDQCPDTPDGEHPSPHRPGCPATPDELVVEEETPHCRDPRGDPAHDCRTPEEQAELEESQHCRDPRGDPAHGCRVPDEAQTDESQHCHDPHGDPAHGCRTPRDIALEEFNGAVPIQFPSMSASVTAPNGPTLRAVAAAMRTGAIGHLRIEGHADDRGDDAFNMMLSRRRAWAAWAWLRAHGVPAGRMRVVAFGETRPMSSNDTDEGRSANRRVEFHVDGE